VGLFFLSCSNFENKDTYTIKVGETFQIYYFSGSESYFMLDNEKKLKNIKLIEHKQLDNFNSNCDGCPSHYSHKFMGLKTGIETISITEKSPGTNEVIVTKKYKVIVE
jgi:hypothetical protein